MTTTTFNWDAGWATDSQITGTTTIADTASDASDDYTTDGEAGLEFCVTGTYAAGVYDEPAQIFVQRKTETTYESRNNAFMIIPFNGSSGEAVERNFTVYPEDARDFRIEIVNDSGLDLTNCGIHSAGSDIQSV